MPNREKNILLTGPPGCGKTTAIVKTAHLLHDLRVSGFHTEEIREDHERVGFRIVTFSGEKGILAHRSFTGGPRVSRYVVDVQGFERLALPAIDPALGGSASKADAFIIDEIGKMECYSRAFQDAIRRLLDSPKPVLATIALKGSGIIAEIKSREDVELISISAANRDSLPAELARKVGALCR